MHSCKTHLQNLLKFVVAVELQLQVLRVVVTSLQVLLLLLWVMVT